MKYSEEYLTSTFIDDKRKKSFIYKMRGKVSLQIRWVDK